MPAYIEVDQQVNVAVGSVLAAGDRTEHADVAGAGSAYRSFDLSAMRAEAPHSLAGGGCWDTSRFGGQPDPLTGGPEQPLQGPDRG